MTEFELKLLKLLIIMAKNGTAKPDDACFIFKLEKEIDEELEI